MLPHAPSPQQGLKGEGTVSRVRIFQPTKTAMQSGLGNTKQWVVEFAPGTPKFHDPLTGWVGSRDTDRQVRLRFADKADAVAFADRHGLDYEIIEPKTPRHRPKSYAENFRSPV
jgi:hypothetical protein